MRLRTATTEGPAVSGAVQRAEWAIQSCVPLGSVVGVPMRLPLSCHWSLAGPPATAVAACRVSR